MTNPIERAVAHLKAEAINRAGQDAITAILRVHAKLAEHGWDIDKAFPRPNGNMGRTEYKTLAARHSFALSLTRNDPASAVSRRYNDPHLRVVSPDNEARYVAACREGAAQQYDAFVAKLVGKIGPVADATLAGSHVWGHSILTVTKRDGSVERWKTQQIVNQSVLGLIFNQWPSRKVK